MTRTRLGFGDFVPSNAPNPVARMHYLWAVSRCVPEAVEELLVLDVTDAWAQRRGFLDPWARHAAASHVPIWRERPELVGRWMIASATAWGPTLPQAPNWDPQLETEAAYLERHGAYVAAIKATAGLAPTPTKDGVRHWEWLALHHVGRWTLRRISEKYGDENGTPDVPAVSKAITESACLIGLTLRPGRGRRKLSRSKHQPTQ